MGKVRQTDGLDDFQALVAAHKSGIFRLAYRLTGNRDDAEDLVQESLIEAFRTFDRFQVGTHFDRWVYRIMLRNYIDLYRRRKRLKAASWEELDPEGDSLLAADPAADPQQVIEKAAWSELLQVALARLPPGFRATVVLCDIEGLSYEEASRAMGCPVGTVRSRLHRARDLLRTWLRPLIAAQEGNEQ
jgi:RNA polymerase sigma-70 factor (ECF subfamily)